MWIEIANPNLNRWKPTNVDVWIDVNDTGTAQVSAAVGEQLIDEYDSVSKLE